MNERIKELIKQAGLDDAMFPLDDEWETPALTKFAELIVRECLDQCYNRGMNDELYAGQLKAAAYIERHLGVEK